MVKHVPISKAVPSQSQHLVRQKNAKGILVWLRNNLFNSPFNSILTLLALWALFITLPKFIAWGFINAVWIADDAKICEEALGACWAVITEKYRIILFGIYPYDQHWRGVAVICIVITMFALSTIRKFWSYKLIIGWVFTTLSIFILMHGGIFGLKIVETHQWGGLPMTLFMFIATIMGGMPLAILLALGRRSELPVIKALSVTFIEVIRGVPLLTVLFMASLIFPLFMPEGFTINQFLRAQVGMIMFFAAYAAEIVRGGLQAIPKQQFEASYAIGLSYWKMMWRIILPQALRIVIPALMNDIIRAFKNTTFVSIIGLFDVLGAASTALEDPLWSRQGVEVYLFVCVLYFIFCYSMSKYSENVEQTLKKGRNF